MIVSSLFGQTTTLYKISPKEYSNTAVIICPGGSYYWLDMKSEGKIVAEWLSENNISAYVLKYPTSSWLSFFFHIRSPYRSQYPAQLESLKEALKIVKNEGFENVGVMGFSAGGHLAVNSAVSIKDSLAPDFVTAIYPVVTMKSPYVHKRSRRGLLGERRSKKTCMQDSLSLELHAEKISCPLFLVNCKDDKTVDYRNSELLYNAMLKNPNSKITYIQFNTGGHGFGADDSKANEEAILWKESWILWLKENINFKILQK